MKIYCSCCDAVQPVVIDDCRDAKTNAPFQDIVCAECRLVIASGTGISPPASKPWVGLTDEELELINDCGDTDSYQFAKAIEFKLKEKNA